LRACQVGHTAAEIHVDDEEDLPGAFHSDPVAKVGNVDGVRGDVPGLRVRGEERRQGERSRTTMGVVQRGTSLQKGTLVQMHFSIQMQPSCQEVA
jgi:hypothetical protein